MVKVLELIVKKKILLFPEEGDDTYVIVRQATQGDMLRLEQATIIESDDTSPDKIRTISEKKRMEAYLTLADSNLVEWKDETLQETIPIFRFKKDRISMTSAEFSEAWGKLPMDWVERIDKAVKEVNPQFSPNYKAK